MKRVNITLTDEEYSDLKDLCESESLDLSEFTRKALKLAQEVKGKYLYIKNVPCDDVEIIVL